MDEERIQWLIKAYTEPLQRDIERLERLVDSLTSDVRELERRKS